jgi:hypothetical protein
VTCSQGTWLNNPTGYAYSWQRNVTTTIGGSANTYTLTAADVEQAITCTVVASNGGGSSAPAPSVPIVPVAPPNPLVPLDLAPPAISGAAVEGQTVTCLPGAWLNSPTSYAYSWQRNVTTTIGTSNTYTLTAADVAQAITCAVVAHNSFGDSPPAVSLPIIPALSAGGSGGSSGSGSGGSGSGGSSGAGGGSVGTANLRRPTVKAFSVAPRRMIVSVHGRRQQTSGLTFRYTLDRSAAVLIVVQRRATGRVAGKRCVTTTRRNQKAKHCARYIAVKMLVVKSAKAGPSRLKYTGRIGKRVLPTSGYRAVLTAGNGAGWSKAKSATFAVVRKAA